MKNILLIFKNSILRNILMIAISAAAAALMVNIFNAVSESGSASEAVSGNDANILSGFAADTLNIGFIDSDKSPLSEDMKNYLTETLGMVISEKNDYDSLADLLIDRNISAIIEVPQGLFENAAAGTVGALEITTLDDYENAAFINAYLESYMQSVKVLSDCAAGDKNTFEKMLSADVSSGNITVVKSNSDSDKISNAHTAFSFAAGFMLMITSGITVFISFMIITDKNSGTYSRMRCSSLKPFEYVIGVNLFGIICCTAMNTAFTLIAYGLNEFIPVPIGLAFAANELFVLFSVGLSVLLALVLKSQTDLVTFAIGYTTLGSMLGGAWFPITDGLGMVSSIAKLFPQYWFMDMIRNMPTDPDYNCVPNICILALSAVLAYLISAVIFTKKNS